MNRFIVFICLMMAFGIATCKTMQAPTPVSAERSFAATSSSSATMSCGPIRTQCVSWQNGQNFTDGNKYALSDIQSSTVGSDCKVTYINGCQECQKHIFDNFSGNWGFNVSATFGQEYVQCDAFDSNNIITFTGGPLVSLSALDSTDPNAQAPFIAEVIKPMYDILRNRRIENQAVNFQIIHAPGGMGYRDTFIFNATKNGDVLTYHLLDKNTDQLDANGNPLNVASGTLNTLAQMAYIGKEFTHSFASTSPAQTSDCSGPGNICSVHFGHSDVTAEVKKLADSKTWTTTVDPDPGLLKQTVVSSFGTNIYNSGNEVVSVFLDHSIGDLQSGACATYPSVASGPVIYTFLWATFGGRDVSSVVGSSFNALNNNGGLLKFKYFDLIGASDPAPNILKSLVISYKVQSAAGGPMYQRTVYGSQQTIYIANESPQTSDVSVSIVPNPLICTNTLTCDWGICRVHFGSKDVTADLRTLPLYANWAPPSVDPDPGMIKHAVFTFGTQAISISSDPHLPAVGVLNCPAQTGVPDGAATYTLLWATFADQDVTSLVQTSFDALANKGGVLNFDYSSLGAGPAIGQTARLVVSYKVQPASGGNAYQRTTSALIVPLSSVKLNIATNLPACSTDCSGAEGICAVHYGPKDVTTDVKKLSAANTYTSAVDPDPTVYKQTVISTLDATGEKVSIFNDQSIGVLGTGACQFQPNMPAGPATFTFLWATFGGRDVSSVVQPSFDALQSKDGVLTYDYDSLITNDDPMPGILKSLVLSYKVQPASGGKAYQRTVFGPQTTSTGQASVFVQANSVFCTRITDCSGKGSICRAHAGSIDVTADVKKVDPSTWAANVDSDDSLLKQTVVETLGGVNIFRGQQVGDLTIGACESQPMMANDASVFKLLWATFGGRDVTSIIQPSFDALNNAPGKISFYSDALVGDWDPLPQTNKNLIVSYAVQFSDAQWYQRTIYGTQRFPTSGLTVSIESNPSVCLKPVDCGGPANVCAVHYGSKDATKAAKALEHPTAWTTTADPTDTLNKQLVVSSLQGPEQVSIFTTPHIGTLGTGKCESYPDIVDGSVTYTLLWATFGGRDVTTIVQPQFDALQNNGGTMAINVAALYGYGDPRPGPIKSLVVSYSVQAAGDTNVYQRTVYVYQFTNADLQVSIGANSSMCRPLTNCSGPGNICTIHYAATDVTDAVIQSFDVTTWDPNSMTGIQVPGLTPQIVVSTQVPGNPGKEAVSLFTNTIGDLTKGVCQSLPDVNNDNAVHFLWATFGGADVSDLVRPRFNAMLGTGQIISGGVQRAGFTPVNGNSTLTFDASVFTDNGDPMPGYLKSLVIAYTVDNYSGGSNYQRTTYATQSTLNGPVSVVIDPNPSVCTKATDCSRFRLCSTEYQREHICCRR